MEELIKTVLAPLAAIGLNVTILGLCGFIAYKFYQHAKEQIETYKEVSKSAMNNYEEVSRVAKDTIEKASAAHNESMKRIEKQMGEMYSSVSKTTLELSRSQSEFSLNLTNQITKFYEVAAEAVVQTSLTNKKVEEQHTKLDTLGTNLKNIITITGALNSNVKTHTAQITEVKTKMINLSDDLVLIKTIKKGSHDG